MNKRILKPITCSIKIIFFIATPYFNEENLRVNENAVACMAESSQQTLREGDVVDASMVKRLKELEAENARLKKMYAEERLKAEMRQEALEGKL